MIRALLLLIAMLSSMPAMAACADGIAGRTAPLVLPGSSRTVLLHRPAGPPMPLPLIVLLHGSGGRGTEILRNSRLAATADRHGFLVVAPDGGIATGDGFAWNIPGVPTVTGKVPTAADPDDVAFIGRIVDRLAANGCVDRARVYATGLSGGGRMASWLGCVASERFAAIAPDVGLRAGRPRPGDPSRSDQASCRPSRPVPVISFAGDADTTNPPGGGGAPYWGYSLDAALARWAEIDGCAPTPSREDRQHWSIVRFTGCRDGVDVVSYVAKGRGHEWLADNDWMWAFLRRFRR